MQLHRDSTAKGRRSAFTVISLMPSSLPTCLFNRPETTNAITCRWRQVSDA
jgi:hypothetical protein